MQVWTIVYHPDSLTQQLYDDALTLVDVDSRTRIKRFYRREDACRTLIGRLLVRMMLHRNGVASHGLAFGATKAGKPFIINPLLNPPIGFNITHDNSFVAMAFSPGVRNPPAFSVGIDVMKVRIPGHDSFETFVDAMQDQLTVFERRQLFHSACQLERLQRFFWMWTLKEAYTKALGIGLGFDFSRIEFDVDARIVRVDGKIPSGWRFTMFVVKYDNDLYQGVVAELLQDGFVTQVLLRDISEEWYVQGDAAAFVQEAIQQLKETTLLN